MELKISKKTNDWATAAESIGKVWVIRSRIYKEGYETQLAESELRYDNAELRARLYKKERGVLLSVLILAAVLVTVTLIVRLMARLLRRYKMEKKRLEYVLKSRTSELNRLKSEKDQDETFRTSLEASSSNKALMRFYNLNYDALRRFIKIFSLYKGQPEYFLTKAVEIAEDLIRHTGGYDSVYALIDTAYPGFLGRLFGEFPGLKEEDRYLIALTCLGYSNGTVSYLLNVSETNLTTKRTRLAHKMDLGKSLVKYLNERLVSYQAAQDSIS